jgi:hypothetical protein
MTVSSNDHAIIVLALRARIVLALRARIVLALRARMVFQWEYPGMRPRLERIL